MNCWKFLTKPVEKAHETLNYMGVSRFYES